MARRLRARGLLLPLVSLVLCGGSVSSAFAADTPAAPLEVQLDQAVLRIESGEHTAAVTSIATTPRGDYIVTASEDRTARVWDGVSGELLRTLRPPSSGSGPAGRLYAAAISADGAVVATAGATHYLADGLQRSSEVYVFDRSTGALLHTLPGLESNSGSERATRLSFSRDGQRLIVGRSIGGGTSVYQVRSGQALTNNLEPQRQLLDADFDAAGRLLAVYSGGLIKLLDAKLHPLTEVLLSDCQPRRARFSPDGAQVAVLCAQGTRLLLRAAKDLKPRAAVADSALAAEAELTSLVWSADGKSLFTAGRLQPDGAGVLQRWPLFAHGALPEPLVIAESLPTDLATRPRGGVLFAAEDPRWGAVDAAGQVVQAVGSRSFMATRPDLLRVDATGERVEWSPARGETLRFQVSGLQLVRSPPPDEALRPPRTELLEHRVTGWRGALSTRVDGVIVLMSPERATSLAAAPDQRSILLGSSEHLGRYLLGSGERTGCPLPDPGGAAPPCARILVDGALAINVSGDGRYAVALLRDGSVRWYRAADLTEQLALYVHRDGKRWVLWQPSGLFAATIGGAELVGYHINRGPGQAAELFPLSRLQKSRQRPEAVAASLQTAARAAAPVSLRQVLPPVVSITAPADGSAVSSPQVVLHVQVSMLAEQKLTALRVLVDGRLTTKLGADGGAERDITIAVPPRDCTLAVVAQTEAGTSTPATLRLRWTGPPPAAAATADARPRLVVLAVGVSAYQRSELRLSYPAKDARDLAALLSQQRPGLYRAIETRVLTDAEATRKGILEAIEWLQRTAAAEDTVLLLLAGHGITDPGSGQYYFLPADADPQSPLATMIPATALQQTLATLPGRVVLLLDTCHAGDVLSGRKLRGVPSAVGGGVNRFIDELGALEQGVVVLTAATGTQASQESPEWGNGAFTKALLEGLGGRADYGKTGRVTLNMLDLYISERVRELTQGAQTPATAKPTTIPDFPLLLSR